MKILILKGTKINQDMLDTVSAEFDVVIANNEQDAIRLLKQKPSVELFVLDSSAINNIENNIFSRFDYHGNSSTFGIIYIGNPEHFKLIKELQAIIPISFLDDSFEMDFLMHLIDLHKCLSENKFQINPKNCKKNLLYRSVFHQAPIGISIGQDEKAFYDWGKNFIGINHAFEIITGRSKKELAQLGWEKITHPDDIDEVGKFYQQLYAGEIRQFDIKKRYIKPNQEIAWVHMHVRKLEFLNPAKFYVSLVEDITEKHNSEVALAESERSKSVLLSNLPGMAYRCLVDHQWTMKFVSQGSVELTGYSPEALIDNQRVSYNDIIVEKYRDKIWNLWQQQIKENKVFKSEYEIITADGKRKWVSEIGQPIYNEENEVIALEGIIIDITENKNQLLQLEYIAEHNMLTGLYNRLYLEETLMEHNHDSTKNHALLVLNFKKINMIRLTYGYSFGERIVQGISTALSKLVDDNHKLFYVSFERLAFYVSDYTNQEHLTKFCDAILAKLIQQELMRTIGCHIGIFEIKEFDSRSDIIIRNASIAAEDQENLAMFGWSFYDEQLDVRLKRESVLKEELIKEVQHPQNLTCHFQPILDVQGKKIHFFEALARFHSDSLGSIAPLEFIPIAEETQLIIPLGKQILEMACDFINSVHELGYRDIKLAVNISTVQLISNHFVKDVISILEKKNVKPNYLNLEITESVFADNFDYINSILTDLRSYGISISIDDFGTGYSSLSRERELNVDFLKIDKFFIEKLLVLTREEAITGDIISMAHKLGHTVIAEGVEQEFQKQYLIDYGCDLIQGYYCGRPMDALSALNELKKHDNK